MQTVPGLNVEMAQLMEDLIGDLTAVPQPIEVKLFGDDPTVLIATAEKVFELLSQGFRDPLERSRKRREFFTLRYNSADTTYYLFYNKFLTLA